MYNNLIEATEYAYVFLNNYSGQQEFIEKEDIMAEIMDLILGYIEETPFTKQQIETIEQISDNDQKMDAFLSIHIENYWEVLQNAVADFLWEYIDLDHTKVVK